MLAMRHILPQRTMVGVIQSPRFQFMLREFRHTAFQPPQHGEGMWPPLADGVDVLGILAGIVLTISLLTVAWLVLPFIVH